MANKSIFAIADNAIFEQIENIKASTFYSKILDLINLVDDDYRKFFNTLLVIALGLVPFVFALWIFQINSNQRHTFEIKQKILQTANNLKKQKNEFSLNEAGILSLGIIKTSADLTTKLTGGAKALNIPANKFTISDFVTDSDTITTISKAKIAVNNFTSEDFANFLNLVSETEKLKIESIKIVKDQTSQTLSGSLEVVHIAKKIAEE